MLNIYPKFSLINNIGMDGTGINSEITSVYNTSRAFKKNKKKFLLLKDKLIFPNINNTLEKKFFNISFKKYLFYKLVPFRIQILIFKFFYLK